MKEDLARKAHNQMIGYAIILVYTITEKLTPETTMERLASIVAEWKTRGIGLHLRDVKLAVQHLFEKSTDKNYLSTCRNAPLNEDMREIIYLLLLHRISSGERKLYELRRSLPRLCNVMQQQGIEISLEELIEFAGDLFRDSVFYVLERKTKKS